MATSTVSSRPLTTTMAIPSPIHTSAVPTPPAHMAPSTPVSPITAELPAVSAPASSAPAAPATAAAPSTSSPAPTAFPGPTCPTPPDPLATPPSASREAAPVPTSPGRTIPATTGPTERQTPSLAATTTAPTPALAASAASPAPASIPMPTLPTPATTTVPVLAAPTRAPATVPMPASTTTSTAPSPAPTSAGSKALSTTPARPAVVKTNPGATRPQVAVPTTGVKRCHQSDGASGNVAAGGPKRLRAKQGQVAPGDAPTADHPSTTGIEAAPPGDDPASSQAAALSSDTAADAPPPPPQQGMLPPSPAPPQEQWTPAQHDRIKWTGGARSRRLLTLVAAGPGQQPAGTTSKAAAGGGGGASGRAQEAYKPSAVRPSGGGMLSQPLPRPSGSTTLASPQPSALAKVPAAQTSRSRSDLGGPSLSSRPLVNGSHLMALQTPSLRGLPAGIIQSSSSSSSASRAPVASSGAAPAAREQCTPASRHPHGTPMSSREKAGEGGAGTATTPAEHTPQHGGALPPHRPLSPRSSGRAATPSGSRQAGSSSAAGPCGAQGGRAVTPDLSGRPRAEPRAAATPSTTRAAATPDPCAHPRAGPRAAATPSTTRGVMPFHNDLGGNVHGRTMMSAPRSRAPSPQAAAPDALQGAHMPPSQQQAGLCVMSARPMTLPPTTTTSRSSLPAQSRPASMPRPSSSSLGPNTPNLIGGGVRPYTPNPTGGAVGPHTRWPSASPGTSTTSRRAPDAGTRATFSAGGPSHGTGAGASTAAPGTSRGSFISGSNTNTACLTGGAGTSATGLAGGSSTSAAGSAAGGPSSSSAPLDDTPALGPQQPQQQQQQEEGTCVICLDAPPTFGFRHYAELGQDDEVVHACVCKECKDKLWDHWDGNAKGKPCPACRQEILGTVRCYF